VLARRQRRWWPRSRTRQPNISTANIHHPLSLTVCVFISGLALRDELHTSRNKDPSLLGCDDASLVEWFPTFRKILFKQSTNNSTWAVWNWRRRHYNLPKRRETLDQQHNVASQKNLCQNGFENVTSTAYRIVIWIGLIFYYSLYYE
jgi:hypothetical protein